MNSNFEHILEKALEDIKDSRVKDAMNYSLLAKGKRLRPQMVYALVNDYQCDIHLANHFAASLEMIHTYSLIHDDLPAMDDDDFRRGMKTCHKEFNEAIAILAGDGLLTYAFQHITNDVLSNQQKVALIQLLADCSGANGMIYGQIKDFEAESTKISEHELLDIHLHKTGKLFAAALMGACIISKHEEDLQKWQEIGYKLGIAFQIKDDILDATSNFETLGKSLSDVDNGKTTILSFYNLIQAEQLYERYFDDIYHLISTSNKEFTTIKNMITLLKLRNK